MRSETTTYATIKYPDAICMAFNPMLIKLSGSGYDKALILINTSTPPSFWGEYRYPNTGGDCWMDMQSYAQGFFDPPTWGNLHKTNAQKTGLGMTVYYSVTLYSGGTALVTKTYSSFVVWGSMVSGETYNGYRRLKWFTNFPFSVGLYADAAATIALCNDGSPTTTKSLGSAGVWNVPLTSAAASKFITIQDRLGTLSPTTFDDTFDLTFSMQSSSQGRVVMRVDLDKTTNEGVYLRWIDRHGFYVYYLFKRGNEQRKVDNGGNFIRENMMQYDDVYGYSSGNGRQQWMEREDVQPLCVPLVDKEDWDFLFGVCCSPIVDLYCGLDANNNQVWKPVRVQAGSYTRMEREHLQDFICNLIMPKIEYQRT